MRLGYVGPLPPLRGGVAQHGDRVVAALRARGHRVDVAAWRHQYPARLYPGDQAGADRLPPGALRLDWWSPRSWWLAGRALRGVEALVIPWVVPVHAPAYRVIARVAGAPVVTFVHNAYPHEPHPGARMLATWFLRAADGYVAHAGSIADEVRAATGRPTAVVPHPPNLDVEPEPLPNGPPWRALALGFVRRYKGVDLAIEAVAELVARDVDVTLTVAGEIWEDGDRLRRMATERGLTDRIRFVDRYLADEEVAELLASHHLLVAPYRSATQSGVAPLAFAAGRPVVATRVGGLPQAITDGVDGVLVPPEDPVALAEGIGRALASLEDLAAGAERRRASWSDVAEAILGEATRAAGGRGPAGGPA